MSDAPRMPTCIGCLHKITHESPIPMKKMGVMMHMGEKFCIGGKRARRFKRSDPKLYAPDWCPSSKEIPLCSVPASASSGEDCARSIPFSSPHRTRSAGLRRGPQ